MHRAWVMRTGSTRCRAYRTALRFGSTRRRASEPVGVLGTTSYGVNGDGGCGMAKFPTTAVTIAAIIRAAGRLGQLSQGPQAPEGTPVLNRCLEACHC